MPSESPPPIPLLIDASSTFSSLYTSVISPSSRIKQYSPPNVQCLHPYQQKQVPLLLKLPPPCPMPSTTIFYIFNIPSFKTKFKNL
ncbi:hypothetical protein TNCV_1481291 [Trichonephila clavipes]|nr:hypothetical protein TNCV_1481291 [Trichonephila clavipes]